MLMRTLVMGDIHGAHKGLMQCLERCNFDPSSDTLIQIGDIPDGFDEVFECVEQLLTINRLISIRGNHDDWLLDFIENGQHPGGWAYGGKGTILSYAKRLDREIKIFSTGNGVRKTSFNPGDIPLHHQNFFKAQKLYHIDEMNNCFVHGGFNRWTAFHGQPAQNYGIVTSGRMHCNTRLLLSMNQSRLFFTCTTISMKYTSDIHLLPIGKQISRCELSIFLIWIRDQVMEEG
jgi:serine/threonine protein phosphatase 1